MKSTSWKDIAELIGISAIVGSLIFVGLQMKQSHEIAISAAYQARTDTSLGLRQTPFESDILLAAWTKVLHDPAADLEPQEYTALQFYFWSEMAYLENMHFQHVNGFITDEQWQSHLGDLQFLFAIDVARETWAAGMNVRESFKAEVDKVLQGSEFE
jgi:hypothetical protein